MNTVESCRGKSHHCCGQSVGLGVQHHGLALQENPTHTAILQDLLSLRDLVAAQLWARGADVITDRAVHNTLVYTQAARLAAVCPTRHIEFHVHVGLFPATGVLCLAPPARYGLAQALGQAMAQALGLSSHLQDFWHNVLSRDQRLAACQSTSGIVVECFFLTNAAERRQYAAHKNVAAAAIANTLVGRRLPPYQERSAALLYR